MFADGATKQEASELACFRAVAHLISKSASQFVLRPTHWKVSPDDLVANLPGADPASGGRMVRPVHARPRRWGAGQEVGDEVAQVLTDAERTDDDLVALVRACLEKHAGEFDPSSNFHRKMRLGPRDERAYTTFNKLLNSRRLKAFIESHSDEFAWNPRDDCSNKGAVISWAHGARQPALGDAPAVGAAPQEEVDVGVGTPPPSGELDALD